MSGPGSYTLSARPAARIALVLCLAVTPAAGTVAPPDSADPAAAAVYDEAVREAGAALRRDDPAAAISLIDRALRVRPEGIEALLLLGRGLVALDRHEDAVRAFDRAAAVAGTDTRRALDALYGRADALARLERNVEAVETLERILAIDASHPTVHHDLGRIHLVLARYEEAMREFRREIALHGAGVERPAAGTPIASAWEGLGIAAYRRGDDATAIEAISRVAIPEKPSPATIDAIFHHGLALARAGRHDEAAAMLKRVLAVDPDHRGALQNLARVEGARGREEDRRRALDRFERLYMQDVKANTLRLKVRDLRKAAEREAIAGNTGAAVGHLKEAAALASTDAEVLMDLARWLYRSGDRAASEKALRDVIGLDPLRAEAHYLIGRLRGDLGDPAGGVAALQRAAQLSPMSIEYHVQLAQTYLRLGRTQDGVSELRLAQRLDPDDPRSFFNLGLALAQAGDLPAAAEQLDEAVRLGYDDPRVHQILARIHEALGNTERSRQEQARYEQLVSGGGASGNPPRTPGNAP